MSHSSSKHRHGEQCVLLAKAWVPFGFGFEFRWTQPSPLDVYARRGWPIRQNTRSYKGRQAFLLSWWACPPRPLDNLSIP